MCINPAEFKTEIIRDRGRPLAIVTHIPTGYGALCDDTSSELLNVSKCIGVIARRLECSDNPLDPIYWKVRVFTK